MQYWSLSDCVWILSLSVTENTSLAIIDLYGPTSTKCVENADEVDKF